MRRPIPAVVLGGGLNGLAVARSLGRHRVPVYVIDRPQRDIAYCSRYATAVPLTDGRSPAAVADELLAFSTRFSVAPALLFTSDYYLRVVSEERERLSERYRLQVPSSEAVDVVSDKARFARFAASGELPVPATHFAGTVEEAEALSARLAYPVLLKPDKSFHWTDKGFKVVRVERAGDLVAQWQALQHSCDELLIQELIEGGDERHYSYCAYRTRDRGEVASLCVNKVRVSPIHGGSATYLRVVHDEEMEYAGKRALELLGYEGVGSVCFKKCARTGRPLIHEINGRLPLWHSVFQMCGLDVPYLMYRDTIGDPAEAPPGRKEGSWMSLERDLRAFREYRSCGELATRQWLATYRGRKTFAEFSLDDLRPLVYCVSQLAARGVFSMRKLKPFPPAPLPQ